MYCRVFLFYTLPFADDISIVDALKDEVDFTAGSYFCPDENRIPKKKRRVTRGKQDPVTVPVTLGCNPCLGVYGVSALPG